MLNRLAKNSSDIENALQAIVNSEYECCPSKLLIEAEEYSLMAGGKHIRGTLCIEFYKLFGGFGDITRLAACLELVHTFSLIHDDLPDMDNDDLRRGKPTCHKQFDNATAILAGDGLSILPYKIISEYACRGEISYEAAIKLINALAVSSGNEGMISGQMLDIMGESKELSLEDIKTVYACKTGAMIRCSCLFGGILAGCNDSELSDICVYADNIGLSFQLVDDLLNLYGSVEELGKPVGTDCENNKNTVVSKIGADKTKSLINECNSRAIKAISKYEGSEFLKELVSYLTTRSK